MGGICSGTAGLCIRWNIAYFQRISDVSVIGRSQGDWDYPDLSWQLPDSFIRFVVEVVNLLRDFVPELPPFRKGISNNLTWGLDPGALARGGIGVKDSSCYRVGQLKPHQSI